MCPIFLQAYSALSDTGIYSFKHGHRQWDHDQNGSPLKVKRIQVQKKPYPGFGKLYSPDKLAFAVSTLLFSDFDDYNGKTTGICLATSFGSLETDIQFRQSIVSGFPSPSCFAATLPSSPIADIAIVFHLKGPNRVIVDEANSGVMAIDMALHMLLCHRADSILVLVVRVLEKNDTYSQYLKQTFNRDAYSYAFLFTSRESLLGLNYSVEYSISNNVKNFSQKRSEKSYFSNIIQSLETNNEYQGSFPIYGKKGFIKIRNHHGPTT